MTAGYGYSAYPYWLPPATTSSSGDATLWLFPDGPYDDYTITASPPAGSGLVAFNVENVTVVSDMTIVVVLQFAQPPPQRSCPLSHGFWKTHSELWPVTSLVLGSQTYTQSELLTLLNTPVKGDASLILAYQLIAAKLSVAAGSDPAPVASTISGADSVLSTFPGKLPYAVKTSSATGKTMTSYAETLESYNNGMLTSTCVPATFTSITSSSQQQAIHDLAADVQALVASGVLNRGQGNSLTMKLEMANNQVGQGKGKTASNLMRAFIHEVVALTQAGVLSPAVRGSLISKADSIIVQLGG